jgi:hypothetical protein
MRLPLLIVACTVVTFSLKSQVSITTNGTPPDPSSMLDVKDQTRGLLIPRMTMAQRDLITLPANALLIYQTDQEPGFYYNQGTPVSPQWVSLSVMTDLAHLEDRIRIDSLPYTITTPGSYYVVADLTGTVGISIATSHVTLDLNGYSIRGLAGNNSEGIKVTAALTNIAIRNGGIVNWGREGIKGGLASNSSFTSLHIVANGLDGLVTGNNNFIYGVVAGNNTFDGIDAGESNTVSHCIAANNLNDGIEADAGSSLLECTARDNTDAGIRTTGTTSILNCTSNENNTHGFSCGAGSVVQNSSAFHNTRTGFFFYSACTATGNTSRNNGFQGFEWLNDCVLEQNSASLNGLNGFYTTSTGGKLDNNSSNTNSAYGFRIQNAGGCLIIRNSASGNGLGAFNVLAGNSFATIVTSANLNANTNPFANFQL